MEKPVVESILNLSGALDRVGGDSELLEEVAQLFLESAPELLAQIRTAIGARDARSLQYAAHTLKGALSNFGAEPAYHAALRLEIMAHAGELVEAEQACTLLETEISRLLPALAELAGRHKNRLTP